MPPKNFVLHHIVYPMTRRLVTCWCCATSRGLRCRHVTHCCRLRCTWQRMGVWKLPLAWRAPWGSISTCTRWDRTSPCGQCSPDPLCNAAKIQGMHCRRDLYVHTSTMIAHWDETYDVDNRETRSGLAILPTTFTYLMHETGNTKWYMFINIHRHTSLCNLFLMTMLEMNDMVYHHSLISILDFTIVKVYSTFISNLPHLVQWPCKLIKVIRSWYHKAI